MISDESQLKAAARMQDAAERMERAADRVEQAVHRLAMLLEDGYGGNGLKLIELLEKKPEPAVMETYDTTAARWAREGKP
jgi:hypothetical protein